jgi:hypothetical protein
MIINKPKTTCPMGNTSPAAFGNQYELAFDKSLKASGTKVMNRAPKILPNTLPKPPTMTAAR